MTKNFLTENYLNTTKIMLLNDMNNSIYEIFNKPLFLTKKVKSHSKSSVVSYIFCIHVTQMYKDEHKKRLYMSLAATLIGFPSKSCLCSLGYFL